MPRYYFDVYPDGAELDHDGTECADIYVAQGQAIRMTGEIMRDLGQKFWGGGEWRLELQDESRRTLFIVRLSAEEVA